MKVADKNILISGGSRGLGFALAKSLADRSARIVLVAREENELEQAARTIRDQGGHVHAIPADVGDPSVAASIAGQAAALVGPIDVVIHNASDLGALPMPLLLDTRREDFAHVLDVNVLGPFALSKALVGSMVLRGQGLVVHITSDAAVEAYPRWGAYGVSKAALDHLTRIWSKELAGTGVRVLSIDPGEMDTKMHSDAMPDADRSTLRRPEDAARRIIEIIESDRSGERLVA
jgi:NAD(P)-dependent dehydrogenase (short-subunit alcohol dehydrogenase family)